jgi:tRNA threonylcarbamoyladenosine biosynthesis protein TsaE
MFIISRSERETLNWGRSLARHLQCKDILLLFGELGSGKTILAKGIALGLGLAKEEVISPSFVLIREYPQARLPLYHFDFYRLESGREIVALGYEEYFFGDGVCLVEWADRLGRLLPERYLRINLEVRGENKRRIELVPCGQRYKQLIKSLR